MPTPIPPTPPSSALAFAFVHGYSLLTNFSSLCDLSTHCTDTLKSTTDLTTVFAPVDSAFAQFDVSTRAQLFDKGNTALRDHFLLRHCAFGDILSTALKPSQELQTLDGTAVHVTRTSTSAGEVIQVENATVTRKDLVVSNGVIHTIGACIPPTPVAPTPPVAPSPAPPTPPAPAPGPGPGPATTYKCIGAKCVAAAGGLNKTLCEQVCGKTEMDTKTRDEGVAGMEAEEDEEERRRRNGNGGAARQPATGSM
jgi:hypothetical protein